MGSGTILTNNEIKDIAKVIRSLGNREILLNGNTRKICSQEGGFLNFLTPLMTAGLPLIKSAYTISKKRFSTIRINGSSIMQLFKRKFLDQAQLH